MRTPPASASSHRHREGRNLGPLIQCRARDCRRRTLRHRAAKARRMAASVLACDSSSCLSPIYYPDDVRMRIAIALALFASLMSTSAGAGPRLEVIQKRGFPNCGIEKDVPGFSQVDAAGRYRGFDIDVCRAIT